MESVRDEEGHAGDEEPEAGSAKFVEEGEGSGDLFYFGDGDFVGDAVTLDYADGIFEKLISVFDVCLFDEQCIPAAVSVLVL